MNCERNICYQQEYNGGCDTCPCNRTAKEAIENLKKLKSFHNGSYGSSIRIAIEALEKQVLKKTTYIHLNTRYTHWGRVRHDQFRCCNCGLTKEFVDGHASQYKFCPQCGLEIDWSDVDAD